MNDTTNPILVTGATGSTGSAIVKSLTDRGVPVRVMVRKPPAAGTFPSGVETVLADFDDQQSLAAALTGVRRAYLVTILPSWQIDGTLEDYAHDSRGEAADVSAAVVDVTGAPPRDIAQFCRDYADSFRAR